MKEAKITKSISFQAMQVGTVEHNGQVLELWDYGTQHKVAVVVTTNHVTSVDWFRDVKGQLYNTKISSLWCQFNGECINVDSNGIIVSISGNVFRNTGESLDKSFNGQKFAGQGQLVKLEANRDGQIIFLQNYPTNLLPAVTGKISFQAMRMGTISYNGQTLELWDYGTPHKAAVVSTNYLKK
jgi:head-tail adaptor